MSPVVVPPQGSVRRERARVATEIAIRRLARELLVAEGTAGVTMRAVARRMDLAPSALYRYVAGREHLLLLVAIDVQFDLVAALEATGDADADAATRLRAVCSELRRWALDHRNEFRLAFADPVPASPAAHPGELEVAGHRLGSVFAELVGELLAAGRLTVPAPDDVDAGLLAAVGGEAASASGLPPTVRVGFVQAWARVYGFVALEVSGQLACAMADMNPMWELTLREAGATMGILDP